MNGRRLAVLGETSVDSVRAEDPKFFEVLEGSPTSDAARQALNAHLSRIEAGHRAGATGIGRIERSNALASIAVLKDMMSPDNEALAGFSTLDVLWRWTKGAEGVAVSPGFVEEIRHLLRAIHGRSGVGRGWLAKRCEASQPVALASELTGRQRARRRSGFLDGLAAQVADAVARFPSGLDEDLIERRRANRQRIQAHLGATDSQWEDGRWQMDHVFRGETGLEDALKLVPLSADESAAIRRAVRNSIPWGITPYYLSLFDARTSERTEDGQVRSQVIPSLRAVDALIQHRSDRDTEFDFMREHETSPANGVTRRYAEVAILKLCDTCPQICTYCQRNWEIADAMAADHLPTIEAVEPALRWFEAHPEVVDVLVTGGDPLVATDEVLVHVLKRLAAMGHVQHIRIGTRVPVTVPMRITDELASLLGSFVVPGRRELAVMTHVESAYEITPELGQAVERLRRAGIRVYNQQVFTVETSRRFQTAANRVALKRVGIDPYYTFYAKGKDEHREHLVPLARIVQERKEEARLLPGIFRTDETVFNVPGLGKNHLRAHQDREWIALRPDGRRVFLFHPWEKGIAPVPPFLYVDVSIAEYLDRIERLGEDPADYASIWFYS